MHQLVIASATELSFSQKNNDEYKERNSRANFTIASNYYWYTKVLKFGILRQEIIAGNHFSAL